MIALLFALWLVGAGPQEVPDTLRALRPDTAEADTARAAMAPPDTFPPGGLLRQADTARTPAAPPRVDTVRVPTRTDDLERIVSGFRREVADWQQDAGRQFEALRRAFSPARLLLLVLALVVAYLAIAGVVGALAAWGRWRPRAAPRLRRYTPLVRFVLWALALWVIFGTVLGGAPLLTAAFVLVALAAVVAAVLYLGRDLLGGLVLLLEQPFQVGDRVAVGEVAGLVARIGPRSFEVDTAEGRATLPNAQVLRRSVRRLDAEQVDAVAVTLVVPDGADLEAWRQRAREAALTSPYVALHPAVEVRAQGQPDGRLVLVVQAHPAQARYADALAGDVLRFAQGPQAAGTTS